MGLVFGAIAPHGGLAIPEACSPEERDLAIVTRKGMEELGRLFTDARPEAVVVATPHNVHIPNAIGVIVASRAAGSIDGAQPPVALDVPTSIELARHVLNALAADGLPAVGFSFGSNDVTTAVAPMDWGVLIPLWFMGGRQEPPVPLVVVSAARELPVDAYVRAGAAIASAAASSGRRVALIASADHGHAHSAGGPFGFHAAAAEYDAMICELVRDDRLAELVHISAQLVEHARADSWWQMLILHGALKGWKGRLISYEAPTYFGMLTAAYEPPS